MNNKKINLESNSSRIKASKKQKDNWSWNLFWNSKITIFKVSLSFIYKNIPLLILTPIFLGLLIGWQVGWSQSLVFTNFARDAGRGALGIGIYATIGMFYLLIYNLIVMIKFFQEEKLNGIYDLELRKGKTHWNIFFQRLAANKIVSFILIALFILIYYIISSFTPISEQKHLMADLYTPGLSWLFIFDTLISLIILILSFAKKIKLTSALTAVFGTLLCFFPLLNLGIAVFFLFDNLPIIDQKAEISIKYGQKINQLKEKYPKGIIDKMINGDGTNATNFASLGLDQWIEMNKTPEINKVEKSFWLGVNEDNNFNTQLLFNGLVPDSQKLLSQIGVIEQTRSQSKESNEYIYDYQETKYSAITAENDLLGLTKAQETYFNKFFTKQENLFFKENEEKASVEEWKNTIFNVDLKEYVIKINYWDSQQKTRIKESLENYRYEQKTNNPSKATNYLLTAIEEVTKNLTKLTQIGDNQAVQNLEEWTELIPIIVDAFKETYLVQKNINGSTDNSFLDNNNIFKINDESDEGIIGKSSFSIGGIMSGKAINSKMTQGNNLSHLFYPVLTSTVHAENISNVFKDEKLETLQEKIFAKMTVKPGTRELMSVMAGLVANSLLVPRLITNNPIDENGKIDQNTKYKVEDIKKAQTKIFIANPFSWIESILTRSARNISQEDQNLIGINSTASAMINSGIALNNYFLDVEQSNKLKFNDTKENFALPLPDNEDIHTPNYNWKELQIVNSSFSPIGAFFGMLITNIVLIGVAYWIFKITLIP